MAHKWGMRFWSNDYVTQADGTDWCDIVADIEHSWGPFEPFGAGGPHVLSFRVKADALSMLTVGDELNDVALCFNGPCGADTPRNFKKLLSNGDYERILFYGEYPDFKGSTDSRWLQVQMPGFDSQILNYAGRLSADTNIGVQRTLIDLEAVGPGASLEAGAWDEFPDATVGYTLDRAAQGSTTNAAYLASHTAGYGMWVTGEFTSTYSGDDISGTPRMGWRPSTFDDWMPSPPSPHRIEPIEITRPWLMQFLDYGVQWGDHPNRVTVTGPGGATGNSTHSAGSALNSREIDVSTYIDNNTECAHAAANLLRMGGMPHINIFDMRVDLELLYKKLVFYGESTDDAEALCWKLGAIRVGDRIVFDYDAGGGFEEPAPAESRYSSEQLQEITVPYYEKKNGVGAGREAIHNVTRVRRTWSNAKGWTVYVSLRVSEAW